MQKPNIKTVKNVTPMIYAYTTPEIARHNGWTKIVYTEQDVETCIKQQTHTADVKWNLEWKGNAIFDDGSGDRFTDKDFHVYLRKSGVKQEPGKNNEWFHITEQESKLCKLPFVLKTLVYLRMALAMQEKKMHMYLILTQQELYWSSFFATLCSKKYLTKSNFHWC